MKTVTISVDLLDRLVEAAFDAQFQHPAGIEGQQILDALNEESQVKDDIVVSFEPHQPRSVSDTHPTFEFDQETSELIARNGGIEGVTAIMARMLLSDYEPKTEGELSDIDLIMNTPTYQELRKGVLDNINRERGIDNKEDE